MTIISLILFISVLVPLAYLLFLALASIRNASLSPILNRDPSTYFIVAVPAHNEAAVIQSTVQRMRLLDYPQDCFAIHVVADHCSDNTAQVAQRAGAIVHERDAGPRTGKGAALSWLFQRVLSDDNCDALVIFDADTQVDPNFLRVMDAHLAAGDQVIQGQHVISNPEAGWFPALTWAMFLIDNRFQNLGRSNLGWSAKNMGDSICFRADVLRNVGWGKGLTEDYELRQRLLLEGIRIVYEPNAIGYGEAPINWECAQAQRARWLAGTQEANRDNAQKLLIEGVKRREPALLDGALQAVIPSYSTLTIASIAVLLLQVIVNWMMNPIIPWKLVLAWSALVFILFVYPFFGLVLEKAPSTAYHVILSGPFFILWRSWLAINSRIGDRPTDWVRTTHGEKELHP